MHIKFLHQRMKLLNVYAKFSAGIVHEGGEDSYSILFSYFMKRSQVSMRV